MQITLDLPDDVVAKADALARKESRSLSSVVLDLIRGARKMPPQAEASPSESGKPWRLPVVEGSRPFTLEEIDRMLEVDGLP